VRRSTALIIPSGSDCSEEAQAFIAWLATPEGRSAWGRAGEGDQPGSNRINNPSLELAAQLFPDGISLDGIYFSDGFHDQLNDAIYQSVNGESAPADALRNLASSHRDDLNRTDSRP
jgi:ABC-type glycerol-3-phosphate transport system substrate-binding protein